MTIELITNARLVTLRGSATPRRGDALRDLGVIDDGWMHIIDGTIAAIGSGSAPAVRGNVYCAHGRVVMPGFVDCHTHACWAGDRFDEFQAKLEGATYLELLKAGGGIMSTVRAVREADLTTLVELLHMRVQRMIRLGTTAAEIKTGYGLNTDAECRMLAAIQQVRGAAAMHITPTFLGAHAIDAAQSDFIARTIDTTLPAAVEREPGIVCDAYCEDGAWSLQETIALFERAMSLGCSIRVHADQFNELGMTAWAAQHGALSVDHLEVTSVEHLSTLAASETFGVMLPCSGFHVDQRFANGRAFIDAGGAAAIASNYNPGSAPTPSMPFTIALACRRLGMTPAEAITCATHNPACLLGIADRAGRLESGMDATLQILPYRDERELCYEFASVGPDLVMIRGEVVHGDSA